MSVDSSAKVIVCSQQELVYVMEVTRFFIVDNFMVAIRGANPV